MCDHMKSPGPECGKPWLRKSCHSLSYRLLFWQKASGWMFSFLGKHPRPPFLQFVLSMPFLRLASFSLDMPCGQALLLLKGCHVSAICARTGRATASTRILRERMGIHQGVLRKSLGLQAQESKNSLQLLLFQFRASLPRKRESAY